MSYGDSIVRVPSISEVPFVELPLLIFIYAYMMFVSIVCVDDDARTT